MAEVSNTAEYVLRRKAISDTLKPGELALVFSGEEIPMWNEINYPFVVDRNFYYLTGVDAPDCILTIVNLNGTLLETLYVPREGNYEQTFFGVRTDDEYRQASGIGNVLRMENFKTSFLMMNFMMFGVHTVVTLSGNRAFTPGSGENKLLAELRAAYPFLTIRTGADIIFQMRGIKSAAEQELLQQAIDITGDGLKNVMRSFRPGMYEYQAQALFRYTAEFAGCSEAETIACVQTGQNANKLHYTAGTAQAKDGELLLMDVGACKEHYFSDVSRTIPVNGVYTEQQKHWYNVVRRAADMIISGIGPGKPREGLNVEPRKLLRSELLQAGLIEENQPVNNTRARNWAACNNGDHPIGLLCHDVGDRPVFEPGMIITVEPGVYLKDLGFGIRIEDDILVTETGCVNLSAGIPRTTEEIEAIMAEAR